MPTKGTEDSIIVMALGYKRTALYVKARHQYGGGYSAAAAAGHRAFQRAD